MAGSGETITYREFEASTNQLARCLRDRGLKPLDHYSIFMENIAPYLVTCAAGERTGLYYTCINSYLQADELAYILNNSESKVLITSLARLAVAREALKTAPGIECVLVIGGEDDGVLEQSFAKAVAGYSTEPVSDERLGASMPYSSGTSGRPKGILRPLPDSTPDEQLPVIGFLKEQWLYRDDMIYLSPAPLYHSAPLNSVALTIRQGGTAVIMERFDPELFLDLVEKHRVTHSQLVPTMFSRMLKLPEDVRAGKDVSSLEVVVHSAAPCPVAIKERMIDWWGPIIIENYGATEGLAFTSYNSREWLAHKGTVGKLVIGAVHVLDEVGNPCPPGEPGELWFEAASEFSYFNNEEKTREAVSADGRLTTVGDVGYMKDGYLYLTDRATFMIVSGGVNIYPQETEDLLITHPKVLDAAVFGVPNEDLGEEVKAVVQLLDGVTANEDTAEELIAFCNENLARHKCPRSIDFETELPRLPTGKLYKRLLKDRYWADHENKII